jgi:DNA-binding transcriptional regulator YbjK
MPKIVDHDAQRQLIVEALWRVVDRDGAAAVSVRSVAAEAGLSRTGMSHYFESQSQLLAMAIEHSIASVTEKILEIDVLDLDLDRAAQALAVMVPTTAQRRRHGQIWLQLLAQANDPGVSKVLTDLNHEVRTATSEILSSLNSRAIINCNVEEQAAVLHAMIDGFSVQVLTQSRSRKTVTPYQAIRNHLEMLESLPAKARGAVSS